MFDVKNQKKGHIKRKLNLVTEKKPILMAGSSKLKVKINEGEPVITILNSGAEINIITYKAANKFSLAIKQQSKVLIVVYNENALTFSKICKNIEIAVGKIRIL